MEEFEDKLKLSPWDFDQSPKGWREVREKFGPEKAVQIIKEYISRNKNLSLPILHFHLGQMLSFDFGLEKYSEAIHVFQQSFMEGRECWNAYVSATIGFLEMDQERIKKAIKTIENSEEEDKIAGNLGIVKNFLKVLEQGITDYKVAYSS